MSERIYNTTEIMSMPDVWKPLKQVIDMMIDNYKNAYPNSKVELVDKHTCWHITIDGVPEDEIDCTDLPKIN